MSINVEELGFSQSELQERVIDQIVERLLYKWIEYDPEDGGYSGQSEFYRKLDDEIKKRIDGVVTQIGEAHVLPVITEKIESLVLQKTNEWGEKKGEAVTFVEYLIHLSEKFMTEPVNHCGKTKKQDSYNWRKEGTRIEYAIDKHLQYAMEKAMKQILGDANNILTEGLAKAARIELENIGKKLSFNVSTGR